MLRVRFHGRGGHGVKTAGRVLGTAAFRMGLYCQDSPVYGAERRGAAVASYTRISQQPICERGVITNPDLIVVADETLLADASAGVLQGATAATALWINTDRPAALSVPADLRTRLVTFDLTGRAREIFGRAVAVSAGLAAGAAKLLGVIHEEQLVEAMREEFRELALPDEEVHRNLALGMLVFAALPTLAWGPSTEVHVLEPMATVVYTGAARGAPSVRAPGNAAQRSTGAWRVERPVIDPARCTRCGLCLVLCPDGAVSLDAEGYPVIDYDHCKGCLICQRMCPVKAVEHERETRVW